MVLSLRPGPDWIPGTVVEVLGPVTYMVKTDEGHLWKRHADQLKSWVEPLPVTDSDPTLDIEVLPEPADPSPLPDPDAVSTSSSLDSRAPSPGGIVEAEMPTRGQALSFLLLLIPI